MKELKFFIIIISFFVFLYSQGCNNTGYEIEESTGPDSHSQNEQSAGIQPVTPTAENLPDAPPQIETMKTETDITKESNTYTIQVGAFSNEEMAMKIGSKAGLETGLEVSYFKVSGLCKIRIGSFSSSEEAAIMLEKVKSAGYKDSFITVQPRQN